MPWSHWFAAVVTVGVLALGGCSGEDPEGEEPMAPPTPSPTAEPTEPTATPTPTPTPTPAEETGGEEQEEVYEVQPGDTLWDIAERLGTTVDALVEANDIDDPSRIFPGDELVVPSE